MRILIADSGATKTDWAFIQEGKPFYMKSSGLHPAYFDREAVLKELKKIFKQTHPVTILFYGAGCYSEESCRPVRNLLHELFKDIPVEIQDDLTAVAHAFLGLEPGVAGILGTGSASGYFSGGKKKQQVASLGYVLGDEGSGADIGKRILKAALRKEFDQPVLDFLEARLETLRYSEVIEKLYRAKRPSYYLAKVSEKVLTGNFPDAIRQVVEESFQSYIDNHLKKYDGFPDIRIVLSGGVASHQRDLAEKILEKNGITDYQISGSVITALAERQMNR